MIVTITAAATSARAAVEEFLFDHAEEEAEIAAEEAEIAHAEACAVWLGQPHAWSRGETNAQYWAAEVRENLWAIETYGTCDWGFLEWKWKQEEYEAEVAWWKATYEDTAPDC